MLLSGCVGGRAAHAPPAQPGTDGGPPALGSALPLPQGKEQWTAVVGIGIGEQWTLGGDGWLDSELLPR
jgi:hypothetical protein